jgi:uncharacterized membrane protein
MTQIFNLFLLLHILGGSLGLLFGMLVIIRRKGDKTHALLGKGYAIMMLVTGGSALVLAGLHLNYFLGLIGIFSLYMVGSGIRYSKHHQKRSTRINLSTIDWMITLFMLVAGIVFVWIGAVSLIHRNWFGLVFLTFGSIGLLFVRQDFQNFNDKARIENYWLTGHLQRMMGSYSAATTAFLVVNANDLPLGIPNFIYWLLPTFIFTPLIIKWSKQ